MTLLLDTHTLLWYLRDDPMLSQRAKEMIEDPIHRILVSIISCWEISIKAGLGKMTFREPVRILLEREIPANDLELLPISLEHATAVEGLPLHNKDPFDRLLIAQAIVEVIAIIGVDPAFDDYAVQRVW